MSLFDDVKALQAVETATEKELKNRFSLLNAKYKSALSMIETLCVQVETLKTELSNAENSKREEVKRLEKESADTKSAFATIMDELRHTQRQKAAITGNRDFWKKEAEALGMLYKLEMEENEKLKSSAPVSPELKSTPVQGVFQFDQTEPVKIAAAIGK